MAQLLQEQKKSMWWYRDVIRAFQSNRANLRKEGIGKVVKAPVVGRMYCYYYDPKLKETLPHYDIFPLTIPIDYYPDGFLGLNLHYLPPFQRKILFQQLLRVASDKKLNPQSSLIVTYDMLKSVATFDGYKKCLKRYLFQHIRSPFLDINPEQWERVVALPLQSFKKGKPW